MLDLRIIFLIASIILATFSPNSSPAILPAADYAFVNGKVYTLNPQQPWAEAVAVTGKEIVFVGSNGAVQPWIGPRTRVVDLAGQMLMPGFIDGHNHFVSGTVPKSGVKLSGARDRSELLQLVKEYVAANPDLTLYRGYGWTFPMFDGVMGTRQELDAISPDKPMILFNEDSHNAWFNTKAMELGGISKDTPDAANGSAYLTREPDGTPAGIGVEFEVWMPMAIAAGIIGGKESLATPMADVFSQLPAAGITAYHEMGIMAPGLEQGYLGYELLHEWEQAGKLPVRVVGVHGTRNAADSPAEHIATLQAWNQQFGSELVQITGVKIWLDGTTGMHTGVLLEPYADAPDTKGESAWTTAVLTEWIDAAYAAGLDVHLHSIGDGSLRRALDAFAAVAETRDTAGRRSVLHHINVIHPDDLPRFQELGIGGNATLEWLVTYWDDAVRVLGPERAQLESDVWKRLIDMGVNVTFGSDIPGTDPDELSPLYQMQIALTGSAPGRTYGETPPADRIPSLEQMLYGYTMAGAYQLRLEDKIGSIETGKRADLIVLERNLFEVPADQLAAVKVLLTMMNGHVTHHNSLLAIAGQP